MSKILHRQPTWGWSVVLLSTLLLSPVTAQAFLHALHLANTSSVRTASPVADRTTGDATAAAESPRRRSDEEERLLRITALQWDGDESRIDPAPEDASYLRESAMHSPTAAAGYFLLPSRTVLLVPDQAPAGKSARRPAPDALLRPGAPRCVAAPRAPPLV